MFFELREGKAAQRLNLRVKERVESRVDSGDQVGPLPDVDSLVVTRCGGIVRNY